MRAGGDYQKLLDDVLYAVSIFYSGHMSSVLSVFDQPLCVIVILLTLLGASAAVNSSCRKRVLSHTLWNDIVFEWLSTVTRTIAFLTLQYTMNSIKSSLETSERGVVNVFITPFLVLFLLISAVKYVDCLTQELI